MQVNPYLNFNGNCEAAFKFYAEALGGKIDMMSTFADAPSGMGVSADWRNKIMHISMTLAGTRLMGSDAPDERYQKPQGMTVSLQMTEPKDAERVFAALSKGGAVRMPLQQTFFATRFGMVTDQFGIPWMVNCGPGA